MNRENKCIFDESHIFNKYLQVQAKEISPVVYTSMIQAHNIHGQTLEALALYHKMQDTGIPPNQHTYATVLSTIADLYILLEGQRIHVQLMVLHFICFMLLIP